MFFASYLGFLLIKFERFDFKLNFFFAISRFVKIHLNLHIFSPHNIVLKCLEFILFFNIECQFTHKLHAIYIQQKGHQMFFEHDDEFKYFFFICIVTCDEL